MGITALLKRCLGRSPPAAAANTDAAGNAQADAALFAEAGRLQQQGRFDKALAHYRRLLQKYPRDFDLLHGAGVAEGQLGHYPQAATLIEQALAVEPEHAAAHRSLGNARRGLGEHERALACYERALQLQPRDADTLAAQGTLLQVLEQPQAALASFEALLRERPGDTATRVTCGLLLDALGRHEEALATFDAALAAEPGNPLALANRGAMLLRLKRPADALVSFEQALQTVPGQVELLINRATALRELGRLDDALAVLDQALAAHPDHAAAHHNRGMVLTTLQRHGEALASEERALELQPAVAVYHAARAQTLLRLARGDEALQALAPALALAPDESSLALLHANMLRDLGRHEEALAVLETLLACAPDHLDAHHQRAGLLAALRRTDEAIAAYGEVLKRQPDHRDALASRGDLAVREKRYAPAIADWTRLIALNPDHAYLPGHLLKAKMTACDWQDVDALSALITDAIHRARPVIEPFTCAANFDDPVLQRQCAVHYVEEKFPTPQAAAPPAPAPHPHGKIRVGYVAGEFRDHATSVLLVSLIEQHDTARFEVFAFDNGWDDQSPLRRRLQAAFTEIVDIATLDDEAAAAAIRQRGIDVLVDLNGHIGASRTGVLRLRPAPLQVSWLGFPGTMGAGFMDYIIADRVIIPVEQDQHYTENVVCLPDTYQPNDPLREIAGSVSGRTEAGLPEAGFVFCCFNDFYKITPAVFDCWLRLLAQVPGSVLWLLSTNDSAPPNLRARAAARGIDPMRLVFARRCSLADHLARHRLADLFLDTLPYNAHTTCSDALWAGLPLLTCQGTAFAGRVAASLLYAIGLPELVTRDAAHYEALALELATQPDRLARLRDRLARNRLTRPLFDSRRFTRHLESAYTEMVARATCGEPPAGFEVPPSAPHKD